MPETVGAPTGEFPAVFGFQGIGDPASAGREVQELLEMELTRAGAVLIRGLPVHSPADFSAFMTATNMTLNEYIGGVTSRPEAAPMVTPASTEPGTVSMEPHTDDPHWTVPPTKLAFYCRQPPPVGGQALLADGRKVLRLLRERNPEVLDELERRGGVRYEHFYPDETVHDATVITSWQTSFAPDCTLATGCDKKAEAERLLTAGGFGFEWTKDGLKKWEVRPAVMKHPQTGEDCWMNQIAAMHCSVFDNHPEFPAFHRAPADRGPCEMQGVMPYHTAFGDGTSFSPEVLRAVRQAQWEAAVSFEYEAGDVMVLDNYLAQHGRWSFEGSREFFLVMVGGML